MTDNTTPFQRAYDFYVSALEKQNNELYQEIQRLNAELSELKSVEGSDDEK